MNNRRKLLIAFGAGALAAPFGSFAQPQGKVWRVGFLWERDQSDSDSIERLEAFKAGMRALGYTERSNYTIEQRSARTDPARLPALVGEFLALKIDLIVSSGTPSAMAARSGARGIPVLIVSVVDPVGTGLAASLSRPGGYITGLTGGVGTELITKHLDLLRQIVPRMRHAGFLYNPDNNADALKLRQFESDVGKIHVKSIRAPVRKAEDIAIAFNALKRDQTQGVIVTATTTNYAWRKSIIEQAARHHVPAVYGRSQMAESGGLISYAPDGEDLYRRVAAYAAKIFKGAKPGDLPIEQPLKFETVINLKTAKALGIKIPHAIMLRADKVIE